MKIGIIGAMDEEVNRYIQELKNCKKIKHAKFDFYSGNLSGKEVVVIKSGIGKVNAAACTQILIDTFKISKIIFTGVAGALNPILNPYEIVISKDSVQHDIDITAFGREKGEIPDEDSSIFKADKNLLELSCKIAKEENLKIISGRVLTGDQFIQSKEKSRELRKYFNGDCVDMETAAVAHVCKINQIPYVAIRSISDKADHSANIDFDVFLHKAAENSYSLVKKILKALENN